MERRAPSAPEAQTPHGREEPREPWAPGAPPIRTTPAGPAPRPPSRRAPARTSQHHGELPPPPPRFPSSSRRGRAAARRAPEGVFSLGPRKVSRKRREAAGFGEAKLERGGRAAAAALGLCKLQTCRLLRHQSGGSIQGSARVKGGVPESGHNAAPPPSPPSRLRLPPTIPGRVTPPSPGVEMCAPNARRGGGVFRRPLPR